MSHDEFYEYKMIQRSHFRNYRDTEQINTVKLNVII